ncbi:hypothetical protein HGP05_09965 [Streptococcus sanguinis]|uniref:Uncharacterized protein n=1 Tax=Streptococcus sanguinis TaxID=1305 RepID=A0A7Y0YS24_STRSA|nr:hypothetical protein [Streptococcus sanguinis]
MRRRDFASWVSCLQISWFGLVISVDIGKTIWVANSGYLAGNSQRNRYGGKERLAAANGYLLMSESQGRMSFNKGYTPSGFAERVFHCICAMRVIMMNFTLETIYRSTLL